MGETNLDDAQIIVSLFVTFTQTANISRRILIEIPFYSRDSILLSSFETKEDVFLRHHS